MTHYLHRTVLLLFALALVAATFMVLPQGAYAVHDTNSETKKETVDAAKKETKTAVKKQDVDLADIIELFIALGIIPEDKAAQARTVLKEKEYTTAKSGCPSAAIKYNLYLGMTDDSSSGEVTRLQTWLATMPEMYPEALVTGYFGPATERAVQRYQAKHGVVSSGAPDSTGYGVVGPKTRSKINACFPSYAAKKDYEKKDYTKEKKEYDAEKEEKEKEDKEDKYEKESVVDEISMQVDDETVTWDTDDYSKHGFKVVWSKDENPTYPTRDGDKYKYLSDSDADEVDLYAFDGDGTYYVRVCEYLGGSCGTYSNEETIELE